MQYMMTPFQMTRAGVSWRPGAEMRTHFILEDRSKHQWPSSDPSQRTALSGASRPHGPQPNIPHNKGPRHNRDRLPLRLYYIYLSISSVHTFSNRKGGTYNTKNPDLHHYHPYIPVNSTLDLVSYLSVGTVSVDLDS